MHLKFAWSQACAVCLVAGAICQFAPVAVAQTAPSALDRQRLVFHAQQQSFAQVVAALSLEMKRGIAADGVPRLLQADFNLEGTAREVLDRVADAFDYQWTLSRSGVVLLSKRFQNPDERPQLNLPELQQMARDANTVLRQASGGRAMNQTAQLINALFDAFSPEQRQILQDGKSLPIGQFTAAQVQLAQAALLGATLDSPRQLWTYLASQLTGLPRSSIQWKANGQTQDLLTGQSTPLTFLYYQWQARNGLEYTTVLSGSGAIFVLPMLPEE